MANRYAMALFCKFQDVEQKNVQEMVNSMKAERKQLENQIADLRVSSSSEFFIYTLTRVS